MKKHKELVCYLNDIWDIVDKIDKYYPLWKKDIQIIRNGLSSIHINNKKVRE